MRSLFGAAKYAINITGRNRNKNNKLLNIIYSYHLIGPILGNQPDFLLIRLFYLYPKAALNRIHANPVILLCGFQCLFLAFFLRFQIRAAQHHEEYIIPVPYDF